MLFTSYEFIAFLAIVFVLYYLVPKRAQWPLLLVFSYIFYYLADPRYLIFILVTTISTYWISLRMEKINNEQNTYIAENKATLSREEKKAYKAKMKAKKWRFLLLCLFLNIGILAVTKYTNFVINNINSFLSDASKLQLVDMIIPMGISFYTFQTMGYIIDVYRGKQEAQKNPFKLALFVSFFPQLVQGPISRYNDLSQTLFSEHKFEGKTVSFGLTRILWGYFKKVVIADRIITAVTTLVGNPDQYAGTYVFIAMLFYAFELYCDFTGGIDITIGIAEVMGIRVAENFNLPYFSKNIKEYWNRWHITMGTWFTDYIFYPISVCGPMLKLSKWSRAHLGETIGKRVPIYLSSFVVWFATGIWHGANWTFIVWGLLHGVLNCLTRLFKRPYEKLNTVTQWMITFFFVNVLWVVFRADSLSQAGEFIMHMLFSPNLGISSELSSCFMLVEFTQLIYMIPESVLYYVNNYGIWIFLSLALFAVLNLKNSKELRFKPTLARSVLTVVFMFWSIVSLCGVSEFLYFNF